MSNDKQPMVWFRTRTVTYLEAFQVVCTEDEINQRDAFRVLELSQVVPAVFTQRDSSTYCSSIRLGSLDSPAIQRYLREQGVQGLPEPARKSKKR